MDREAMSIVEGWEAKRKARDEALARWKKEAEQRYKSRLARIERGERFETLFSFQAVKLPQTESLPVQGKPRYILPYSTLISCVQDIPLLIEGGIQAYAAQTHRLPDVVWISARNILALSKLYRPGWANDNPVWIYAGRSIPLRIALRGRGDTFVPTDTQVICVGN